MKDEPTMLMKTKGCMTECRFKIADFPLVFPLFSLAD